MGGNFSFTANADSVSTPGAKCILSDKIDGVTAEKLFAGLEKYIRDGKTKGGQEAEFSLADEDGGVHIMQAFNVPELFGGGTYIMHNVYRFDPLKHRVEHDFFSGQTQFDRKTPMFTSVVNILSEPVRVESWTEAHEVRSSGKLIKAGAEKVVAQMGSKATAAIDQPSLSDETKCSCITEPIEDASISADAFLDWFKSYLTETMQATELPDGTIIEERSGFLGEVGMGAKTFAKHVVKQDENHIYCYEYGEDESLTELAGVTHLQVHSSPFRLEWWNVQTPGRRAGEAQQKVIQPFIEKVLKSMEEA